MELSGKVAIVTGGGSGIGEAIARTLARQGASVVVAGRRRAPLEGVAAAIVKDGGKAVAIVADVSQEADAERLVRETLTAYRQIDILVNNAGLLGTKPLLVNTSTAEWDELMAVNLRGAFLCVRAVLPHMVPRRSGVIVNVISNQIYSSKAVPGYGAYVASKMGLIGLTRVLANEVHEYGIRVHGIYPGAVATPLTRRPEFPPERLEQMLRPEDVAEAVRWLVSQPPRVNIEELTVMPFFFPSWRN
ncbi:MAG: SDR family NAD(P)-dependent oxidoreductase [Chloroflexi bacterium]|nr:SDR family NAD(P)-dependent oxidoreductase [Chloroflexota bacterium]